MLAVLLIVRVWTRRAAPDQAQSTSAAPADAAGGAGRGRRGRRVQDRRRGGSSVGPAPPPPGATVGSDPTVAALAAEYWERRMEADPIEATEIGDRRFDDRMPD